LLPLTFVVIVSAVKDLFEDLKRHQSDAQENNRKVLAANVKTG
jgi:phospholipid-transporting ATPase